MNDLLLHVLHQIQKPNSINSHHHKIRKYIIQETNVEQEGINQWNLSCTHPNGHFHH